MTEESIRSKGTNNTFGVAGSFTSVQDDGCAIFQVYSFIEHCKNPCIAI